MPCPDVFEMLIKNWVLFQQKIKAEILMGSFKSKSISVKKMIVEDAIFKRYEVDNISPEFVDLYALIIRDMPPIDTDIRMLSSMMDTSIGDDVRSICQVLLALAKTHPRDTLAKMEEGRVILKDWLYPEHKEVSISVTEAISDSDARKMDYARTALYHLQEETWCVNKRQLPWHATALLKLPHINLNQLLGFYTADKSHIDVIFDDALIYTLIDAIRTHGDIIKKLTLSRIIMTYRTTACSDAAISKLAETINKSSIQVLDLSGSPVLAQRLFNHGLLMSEKTQLQSLDLAHMDKNFNADFIAGNEGTIIFDFDYAQVAQVLHTQVGIVLNLAGSVRLERGLQSLCASPSEKPPKPSTSYPRLDWLSQPSTDTSVSSSSSGPSFRR